MRRNLQCHSLLDHIVESADGLLHGSQTVRSVCVHNVDVLEVETLQRGRETLDNVLARETVVVDKDLTIHSSPVDLSADVSISIYRSPQDQVESSCLGADHKIAPLPAILLDGLSHGNLRLAGRVAMIDESVPALFHFNWL